MFSEFIHLHVHSEYSLDIGFLNIDDYVKYSYENKFKVLSITERFNLSSSIKFYKKCFDFGIKPIIGCEIFIENDNNSYSKFLFLSQNFLGYQNLCKIISKSYLENFINGIPIVKKKWLLTLNEGLIVIALSFDSDLGQCLIENDYNKAKDIFNFWKRIFKDKYYMSITRFGLEIENLFLNNFLNFLDENFIHIVATNEVCFLRYHELNSYKSKIAIFDFNNKSNYFFSDLYFKNRYMKSNVEMNDLFIDINVSCMNSVLIGEQCNLFLKLGGYHFPKYLKKNIYSSENFLLRLSFEKLFEKIFFLNYDSWIFYLDRLKKELSVINNVGFANYFLVTHDFIFWSKCNDIFVGPGRGSGSGSLVAYLLSITDIDPIKFDLLFERFLNSERISSPDFDIDFCIEGRDLVLDYIFREYNFFNVAQIIVFASMNTKAVIRDIGRVLGYSYNFVDKIVKLISNNFGISLRSEIINNIFLKKEYDLSYDIQNIINTSLNLEGIVKGIGKHAGGLVISPFNLLGNIPLSYDIEDFNLVTQIDKIDVELLGFIKFDFLGLKTLSLISGIMECIFSYYEFFNYFDFKFDHLLNYNKNIYLLIQSADTIGIFQFDSFSMKSILQQIKPNSFFDMVALIALYRPGPLQSGMLLSYLKRKIGLEKIDFIHPILRCVLEETCGIIVYQEQVMLIAQVFANYSVSSADFLRIAMTKKNVIDMKVHLELFSKGAELNNIDRKTSEEVFYLVEKFAGYGFNKAHSVGYAILSYKSAYLKSNFNTIFMATLLSSDMYNYLNVKIYINECFHFNIKIYNPDINRSFYCFSIYKHSIYYGLGSIKCVGLSLISDILQNRYIFGSYFSFFDFLKRININLISKKSLQFLIYSSIFDKFFIEKFKLILIGIKFLNFYDKIENFVLFSKFDIVLNDYFNFIIKKKFFLFKYKLLELQQNYDILYENVDKINMYNYDFLFIENLSYLSGNYINIFFSGIIKNIFFKNILNNKFFFIEVFSINDKRYEIIVSDLKYRSIKHLLKKGSLLVFLTYLNKIYLNEILIENFYLFKYLFVKFIDFIFYDYYLLESFFKLFFFYLKNNYVYGNTLIRFNFKIKNFYMKINLNKKFKIALTDEFLNFFIKMNEIKFIKIIYEF